MIKRYLFLFLVLIFSFESYSQYYKDQNYFIGGSMGYQLPLGDFGDQANGGPNFRLAGRKMLNKKLSVGAELSLSLLGQDKFWDGSHLGSYDVSYNIGSALLRASYYFDAWDRDFRPYASLAFGYFYYRNEIDYTASSLGSSNDKRTITENKVGLAPNIGFLYHISDTWSFDMNLRYAFIPNFPDSVTSKDEYGEDYQYYLGFDKISLPELSIGFFYRF
ncbi:outer membrane beta-barrel protein [Marinifilum fragile]|uniref:outer membrane beta-barrel protein n=1 Tax=Marinifilum fragile TaxID=570161 RepID=UPI002AA7225A|nr:OmpW family outer membrane protein [Marinifilum fragile]